MDANGISPNELWQMLINTGGIIIAVAFAVIGLFWQSVRNWTSAVVLAVIVLVAYLQMDALILKPLSLVQVAGDMEKIKPIVRQWSHGILVITVLLMVVPFFKAALSVPIERSDNVKPIVEWFVARGYERKQIVSFVRAFWTLACAGVAVILLSFLTTRGTQPGA